MSTLRRDPLMLTATFLVGAALLSFEILGSRTLGVVLGPGYTYLTLALAMLAMSSAGSLMSVRPWHPTPSRRATVLFAACVLLAVLMVASYHVTAWAKGVMNLRIVAEGMGGGAAAALSEAASTRPWATALISVVLSGPYFLFGFILAALFQTLDAKQYPSIYAADLAGGGLGCLAIYWCMEHSTYWTSLMMPPVCLVAAAVAFLLPYRTRATAALACAALVGTGLYVTKGSDRLIEPGAELHQLGKDWGYRARVTELWRGWNSVSRVTAVETVTPDGRKEAWMSFGNGEGHAALLAPRDSIAPSRNYPPSRMALLLGPPQRTLVLFAGAGADMQALDEDLAGTGEITGVELNGRLLDGARALPSFGLETFYRKSNIRMVKDDARAFLERTTEKYDVVLLSWSGASPAYFDGSISNVAQYVFTRQAMARIFDRLSPGGYAVYLSTNKLSLVAAAREILEERGKAPRDAVVLLSPRSSNGTQWTLSWDTNALLIRPDGFSRADVDRIRAEASRIGHDVVYSPFEPMATPDALAYDDVLTRPAMSDALRDLSARANLRFEVITDDRPYSFDLFPPSNYFSLAFWKLAWAPTDQAFFQYRAQQLVATVAVTLIGAVLILSPVLLQRRIRASRHTAAYAAYFAAIGAGFMLIEIGLMQKATLLLGDPGLSIAVVLAVLIFSTGLGSFLSVHAAQWGLTIRRTTIALLMYGGALAAGADVWVNVALGQTTAVKCLWLVAVMTPAGVLLGQFMPWGLARAREQDVALVPWGWAINGVSATLAAGLAQSVAATFGIRAAIGVGVLLYGSVLVWPPSAPDWRVLPDAAPDPADPRLLENPSASGGWAPLPTERA